MKIVIDIPDEVAKENTPKAYFEYFGAWSSNLTKVFENAVVLPKGHGNLISRNALKEEIAKRLKEPNYLHENEDWQNGLCIAETLIDTAPTVPERQKGEWKIQPHSMIMRCSLCGHEETAKDVGAINPDIHFCSSCGAEMQIKEDTPCPCIDCIFKSTNSKKDCAYCEAWYKWSLE